MGSVGSFFLSPIMRARAKRVTFDNKNKKMFFGKILIRLTIKIVYCSHLFVTLRLCLESRLHLGKTKEKGFSFGFSLDLHYL